MLAVEQRSSQILPNLQKAKDRTFASLRRKNADDAWLKTNIAGLELVAGVLVACYLGRSEIFIGSASVVTTEYIRNFIYIARRGFPPLHV